MKVIKNEICEPSDVAPIVRPGDKLPARPNLD